VRPEGLGKFSSVKMAERILGKHAQEEHGKIQLSNNTVHRRIQDLSDNAEYKVVTQLKLYNGFYLQIDEPTDISILAMLLVFARYFFSNMTEEDLLCRKYLGSRTLSLSLSPWS
jgi:hypothetical protein